MLQVNNPPNLVFMVKHYYMSDVAIEEGCPVEPPTNLEEILARPVAPVANPLPPDVPHATPLVPAVGCDPVEQKKFSDCVQPLTAFQPHPLAVIRQPKQIDEACKEFQVFSNCRANVNCRPLWADGAPQLACQSSNTLLSCALPVISEKCGTVAAQFITDYVDRFAKAINPSCKITAKSNDVHAGEAGKGR
uniref:Uncharacterized protein n=1 Tax=Parascaris equorum TaxID=6256 RepID=A0A914RLU8_PAREQ